MSRAVAPMRPPTANEDLAIVTFNPLPGNELNFNVVRNVVREFLVVQRIGHRAVRVRLMSVVLMLMIRIILLDIVLVRLTTFNYLLPSTMRVEIGGSFLMMIVG